MNWLHHHIHHHAKKVVLHMRTHHKKYLFAGSAVAAFFAITKVLVFFATSFALFATSHDASFADDLVMDTIAQDTGAVLSGIETQSDIISDADLALLGLTSSGVVDTGVLATGDVSIDTGALLYLMSIHAASLDTSSGTELTGLVNTWLALSGTVDTGVLATGTTSTDTGSYYETLLTNQITYCHTGDLVMDSDFSGETFAGIIPFQWTYASGCITDNLSFQLYDHNKHWIEITKLSGSNLGFSFDSKFLLTGGWYPTTGLNASGLVYLVSPGLYSGVASAFATGYKVRIINDAGEQLYQSSEFTIDNTPPTLSDFKFVYYTWTDIDGEPHFTFSSSEELDAVSIVLSSGRTSSQSLSGNLYDFYLRGFGTGFSGNVRYTVSFSDLWGNTGSVSGTGFFSFSGTNATVDTFTGAFSALLAMKQEISKFNSCKAELKYKAISLDISDKHFNLAMPSFQKSEVKKLVTAFSYFMVKKLDTVDTLTQAELDEITKTYNNFLVVLKLVKDDDNQCSQNLGNYYMGLFETTMANYWITEL